MRTRIRTRGFTLVELLVAMGLGMLIMLAVGSLFLNTRQNSSAQSAYARVQENGRIATDWLAVFVRNAGARNGLEVFTTTAFPADANFQERAVIRGVDSGSNTAPDEFTVRMQWGQNRQVMDCNGMLLPQTAGAAQGTLTLRFYVQNGNLMCDSTNSADGGAVNSSAIARNVTDLQVLYGQDRDAYREPELLPPKTPTRYVTAAGVTNPDGNWSQITSVRFCLTAVSDTREGAVTLTNQTYDRCSGVLSQTPSPTTAADRRLYKNFVMLVNLRNGSAE